MNKRSVIFLLLAALIFMLSCGKNDEDLAKEEKLLGHWIAYDDNGNQEQNIPEYFFEEDNEGYTSLDGSHEEMNWEVVGGQLKVYYDKAPENYLIGYDKYNSRSLFQIHELEDDYLHVTQFYNDGFQADLEFYRQ
ncbi:MAG: hypothetical protein ACLFM1_09745 [Bacteroidales bacterium]